jgi:spore germination protein KC
MAAMLIGSVKQNKRIMASCVLLLLCVSLAGCWDRQELQDRGMIVALAVDLAKPEEGGPPERRLETFAQPHGRKLFYVTAQVVKYAQGGGGGAEEKSYTVSNTGELTLELVRDMLGQTSKTQWWEQLQAIVVSEDVVKEVGLSPIIDWLRRKPNSRWRVRLYVTPGEAKRFLEYQPPSGERGGQFLEGILRNHPKNTHVVGARTDLGYIIQAIDNGADHLVPLIELNNDMIKASGAAVFKKDKFVGYIDEYATKGSKFIRGTERSAIIVARCPVHPEDLLVFEVFLHETKLTPVVQGDQIFFRLDINMTGNIGEISCSGEHASTSGEYQRKAEQLFADEVIRNIHYSHKVLQSLNADVLNFAYKLKAHEPATWEKIKDRWDELFPTIPLVVSVNIRIRSVGEHN